MTIQAPLWLWCLIPGAYLLGSIPFGLLIAKTLSQRDVRAAGSGNIGAANVARVAGPLAGILTLILDAAKGAVAVWLAAHYSGDRATWMMAAALAALIGHCFPIWLGFRGGKGVATALGIFAVLCPPAAVSGIALFIVVAGYWKYVSLASVSAAAAMPLLIYFLWAPHHAPPTVIILGTMAASLLVIYKHDANLQRLVEGSEPKFSVSKSRPTK